MPMGVNNKGTLEDISNRSNGNENVSILGEIVLGDIDFLLLRVQTISIKDDHGIP